MYKRQQFESRTHKRLIDILKPSNKTVEALMSLQPVSYTHLIDTDKNKHIQGDVCEITAWGAKVRTLVIATDEELDVYKRQPAFRCR